jgi:hypothetical protein
MSTGTYSYNTSEMSQGVAALETGISDGYPYFGIVDSSTDTGFPFKNGEGITSFSFGGYFNIECSNVTGHMIGQANLSSLVMNSARQFGIQFIDYPGGTAYSTLYRLSAAYTNKQNYHVVGTFDSADRSYRMSVWDCVASAALAPDITGIVSGDLTINSIPFTLGRHGSINAFWWGGIEDECFVFNRPITTSEITDIREGNFSFSAPSGGVNRGGFKMNILDILNF